MNVLRFQARNSAEAIRQIHSQLGAEAVVLSVTPLPVKGLSRLWRRPRLEVLAGLPEEPEPEVRSQEPGARSQKPEARAQPTDFSENAAEDSGQRAGDRAPMSLYRAQSLEADRPHHASRITHHSPVLTPLVDPAPCAPVDVPRFTIHDSGSTPSSPWRTAALLQQMGLQPLCIDQVLDRVRFSHGEQPPVSFAEEFALVREALGSFWQAPPAGTKGFPPIHVFVGPPGSGKTTALCKWLAKSVLTEGLAPRAWRLDSRTANFAGLLDFYSEILGVGLEREWRGVPSLPGFDLGFVDLPGSNPQDTLALKQLRNCIEAIPAAQVHLVLNAAYEIPVLLAQVRAFASLPVSDLILTHLDEEKRRGKLWNLILGTNCSVRFLSGGQNIPGEFSPATPELLFSR